MSTSNSGTLRRDIPRLQFVRGYSGQSSQFPSEHLKRYSNAAIRSGMCISKFYNTATEAHEWKIGHIAGSVPYVAVQDYDDNDVIASGNLISGIPLSGDFEFRTGYYAAGTLANWDSDKPITAIADGVSTSGAESGKFKIATSGDVIVGYVNGHQNGPLDVAAENTNVTPDADGKVLVVQLVARFAPGNLLA